MLTEYKIYLPGVGHFAVSADIYKVSNIDSDIECEVQIIDIKKFSSEDETYVVYDPVEADVLLKLEQQVAVKFFNALH